jgi:uncharacterized protein (DUF433 family)
MTSVDWNDSPLVERVPGKVSGRPVVRGTRILAETLVEDYALGSSVEELLENYPVLTRETLEEILSYAASHRALIAIESPAR